MALFRGEQISGSVASASYALTASYVVGLGNTSGFQIASGSVSASVGIGSELFLIKSGSSTLFTISNQGSTTISSSAQNIFLLKGIGDTNILRVSQSGVVVFATQSTIITDPAPVGGIYFTSSSFFVGLE